MQELDILQYRLAQKSTQAGAFPASVNESHAGGGSVGAMIDDRTAAASREQPPALGLEEGFLGPGSPHPLIWRVASPPRSARPDRSRSAAHRVSVGSVQFMKGLIVLADYLEFRRHRDPCAVARPRIAPRPTGRWHKTKPMAAGADHLVAAAWPPREKHRALDGSPGCRPLRSRPAAPRTAWTAASLRREAHCPGGPMISRADPLVGRARRGGRRPSPRDGVHLRDPR